MVAVVVSIKDQLNNYVYENKAIKLFKLGGEFISESISLLSGNYKLSSFMLIDKSGNVLFITPLAGSRFAYLVSSPLEISFTVTKDETTKLAPEVISTEHLTPCDFGYSTFSFVYIKTFDLLISTIAANGNTMNPIKSLLTIRHTGHMVFQDSLDAGTNSIIIPEIAGEYELCVTKSGYYKYIMSFTLDSLKKHSTPAYNPLIIVLYKVPDGLILWNKLGSIEEIENSEVGLNGTFNGGSFMPGVFGNAYTAQYFQDTLVRFISSSSIVNSERGCIEFWGKLTDPDPYVTESPGIWYSFFVYGEGSTYGIISMYICANNGLSSGGIAAIIRKDKGYTHFSSCGTQMFTNSIPLSNILGAGNEENWHHYAIVWDKDGIPGVLDGSRRIVVIFDGQVNSTFWHLGTTGEYLPWIPSNSVIRILHSNDNQGSMSIDNLKIWNYAKTDFSDRYYEMSL